MKQMQPIKTFTDKARDVIVRHPNLSAWLLLTILSIVVFWPMLVQGRAMMGVEQVGFYHVAKAFFRESVLAGDFPLWCPYPAGGTFFVANSWNSTFYPLTWLYPVFPTTYALGLLAVIHNIIFAFFFFRLARECNISLSGSMIPSLSAYLGGVMIIMMDYTDLGPGLAWLPVVIFYFVRLLKTPNVASILWLALACTMQVLAGSPYPPFYSMVALATLGVCYVVFNRLPARAVLARVGATATAGGAALLLSAPQLAPLLVATRGIHEFGKDALFPSSFSMRIADWLHAAVPNVLGLDENFKCFYLGMPVLMLAGFGVWWLMACKITKTPPPPGVDTAGRNFMLKMAASFAILAAVGIFCSFGGYLSLDAMLDKLPLIGRCTRWMSLMGVLFVIGAAVLAGVGFDMLMEAAESRRLRRAMLVPLVVCICIGAGLLIFKSTATGWVELFRAHYWRWIHSSFLPDGVNLKHFPPGIVVLKFALLTIAGAVLLMLPLITRWKKPVIAALFAACILADHAMFYQTRPMSATSDVDIYNVTPPIADYLNKREPDGLAYRVYIPGVLTHLSLLAAGSRRADDYLFTRSYLGGIVGLRYHISTSNTMASFREGGVQYVLQPWMESLPPGPVRDYILGLWNVKYIIDYSISPGGGLGTNLRENPRFQPRAWLSYAKYPAASLVDSLRIIQGNPLAARDTVILVDPGATDRRMTGTPGTANVSSIKYTNNTVTITAIAERDAWLYTSDTYEKSWRAYIDGRETKIFRANMNGRAVAFPAGTHTVVFRYSPPEFWIGLWIGAAAWLALTAYGIRTLYKDRKKQNTNPQTTS